MTKGMNLLVLAGLILALILNSIFVIDEKEDGIVFQFGEAIRSDLPTGLNFKLPMTSLYFANSYGVLRFKIETKIHKVYLSNVGAYVSIFTRTGR